MKIIGIDPGVTGALALIDNDFGAKVEDLPIISDHALTWIDANALLRTFFKWRDGQPQPIPVYIERQGPRPGQGMASAFKSGVVLGSIIAIAQAACCQVHLVSPAKWKSVMGLSSEKEASLDKARLLFPLIELERKKDHNRAEALLLAQYGLIERSRLVAAA
jgi:crossover junction endodeoxyribonuclease RuvC